MGTKAWETVGALEEGGNRWPRPRPGPHIQRLPPHGPPRMLSSQCSDATMVAKLETWVIPGLPVSHPHASSWSPCPVKSPAPPLRRCHLIFTCPASGRVISHQNDGNGFPAGAPPAASPRAPSSSRSVGLVLKAHQSTQRLHNPPRASYPRKRPREDVEVPGDSHERALQPVFHSDPRLPSPLVKSLHTAELSSAFIKCRRKYTHCGVRGLHEITHVPTSARDQVGGGSRSRSNVTPGPLPEHQSLDTCAKPPFPHCLHSKAPSGGSLSGPDPCPPAPAPLLLQGPGPASRAQANSPSPRSKRPPRLGPLAMLTTCPHSPWNFLELGPLYVWDSFV